ncbi:Hsp20 family protein [Bacillus mangrovi]|uniref:Hsp20 family protein n=1 Tax=Metabacillus mangrovi TaxID=1491830 RepID=A0A7X2S989_9BACI|nr:Hsp20/alpha crystallin family protein [Metabacillus mangrovi]MTH55760.1 Hsp20 family protein [Metabacillus mangrovi]
MEDGKNKTGDPMKMINAFFTRRPAKTLLDTIDDLFTRQPGRMSFHVHLSETESHYVVKAEVPGVSKEEIELALDKSVLTIRIKPGPDNSEGAKWEGAFRTIELPGNALTKDLRAMHQNGILTVRVPKRRKKKIPID